MYFYELHEGDNDLFHDLLLAHETEIDPETFFALVQEIRERVVDDFEQDTLIEAIAEELERSHGFEPIWDSRLTAAVNVSRNAEDAFLTALDQDDEVDDDADFRTLYAAFRPESED